jgi:hypothetical protein
MPILTNERRRDAVARTPNAAGARLSSMRVWLSADGKSELTGWRGRNGRSPFPGWTPGWRAAAQRRSASIMLKRGARAFHTVVLGTAAR